MLDTSFLVDLLRGHARAVALLDRLEETGEAQLAPAPAVFELSVELGRRRTPPARARRVLAALEGLSVVPFNRDMALRAGRIAGSLEDAGTPIDDLDCMVAATALKLGERLPTANRRHFAGARAPRRGLLMLPRALPGSRGRGSGSAENP